MIEHINWSDIVICKKCTDLMAGCERWKGIDTKLRHNNREIRVFKRSNGSWNIATTGLNSSDPVKPVMHRSTPLSFASKGEAIVAAHVHHRNLH